MVCNASMPCGLTLSSSRADYVICHFCKPLHVRQQPRMPTTPMRLLGWAIGLSPLLAIVALVGLPVMGIDCRIMEATPTPCHVLGGDMGSLLYGARLFAAWGWIVTIPAGVVVGVLVRQFSNTNPSLPQTNTLTGDVAISRVSTDRLCESCGFKGPMKTWLRNYSQPQFIALLLTALWVFPGVIFVSWMWGKFACPRCGKVGGNVAV